MSGIGFKEIRASMHEAKLASDRRNFWVWIAMRPLSFPLTWLALQLRLSPNFVTGLYFLANIGAAVFFITASYEGMIYGALLYNLGLVLDCVDGNMARTTGKTSPLGWFLDTLGADFFYGVFFIPIGIGVALSANSSRFIEEPLWFVVLGSSATVSILLYRISRMRLHLASLQLNKPKDSERSNNAFPQGIRKTILVVYNNVMTAGGSMLPLIIAAAIFELVDIFILGYGLVAPLVITIVIAYHTIRFVKASAK